MANGDTSAAAPARRRIRTFWKKPLRDAVIASVLFGVATGPLMCEPTSASPTGAATINAVKSSQTLVNLAIATDEAAPLVQIATASSPTGADAIYKRTSADAAWALLALTVSALTALNLAMVRHLRQAYARPSRRGLASRNVTEWGGTGRAAAKVASR